MIEVWLNNRNAPLGICDDERVIVGGTDTTAENMLEIIASCDPRTSWLFMPNRGKLISLSSIQSIQGIRWNDDG